MLADRARTGYVASRCRRRCRSTRRSSSARGCTTRSALGLDAIVVNGVYPERFSGKEADALRAAANGLEPGSLAAVRAALAEHERGRTQRTPLRRLSARPAPVSTLPFLFDAEIGLDEYAHPAGQAGLGTGDEAMMPAAL